MESSYLYSLQSNPIFAKLFVKVAPAVIDELVRNWESPYRFYHSIDNHLIPMLDRIKEMHVNNRTRNTLEIIAWFHDCIYDPKSADNEEGSVRFFHNRLCNKYCIDAEIIENVIDMTRHFDCEKSKTHSRDIAGRFADLDLDYLNNTSVKNTVRNELLMLKEFQFADYSTYRQRRLNILADLSRGWHKDSSAIRQIREYLASHRPRIGIYPGSFNPFHVGHLSVLQEAEKLFDKVIIAVGINPQKQEIDDIGASKRVEKLSKVLPYHQVEYFSTFLHEYVEKKSKDADVTVIRGFRSGYDIDYELTNLAFMRDMSEKDVKMVFIAPQKKFDHVSSSALRLIKNFGDREAKAYIPEVYYPS